MSDKVKIVDKNGEVTECVTRNKLDLNGFIAVPKPDRTKFVKAASVIVLDKDNNILVQRRSKKTAYYPDCYDFSTAHLEHEKENSKDCAIRSLKSELNLNTESINVHFCFSLLPNEQADSLYHDVYFAMFDDLKLSNEQSRAFHWENFDSLIEEMTDKPDKKYAPAFKSAINKFSQTRKILIIDDNPIPVIQTIETLLLNLNKSKDSWKDYVKNKPEFEEWEELKEKNCYNTFYGKFFTFLEDETLLSLYIYDPTIGNDEKENIEKNNNKIESILSSLPYTYIWMDSGHSAIKIIKDNIIELNDGKELKCGAYNAVIEEKKGFITNSMDQIEDAILQPYLARAEQLLIYTYNPDKNYSDIEKDRRDVCTEIEKVCDRKLKEENIRVFETSETIKFYSEQNQINGYEVKIKSGAFQGSILLGTVSAYELYGRLLGSVLYDALKYHLGDFSDNEEKRYNFFNGSNINFLGKLKQLNKQFRFGKGHKVGLVSFQYDEVGHDLEFLIDSPYKEYYGIYDKKVSSIVELHDLFNIATIRQGNHYPLWLRFIYKYDSKANKIFYQVTSNHPNRNFSPYILYLHSALFYSPDFYSKGLPEKKKIENLKDFDGVYEVLYFVSKEEIIENKSKGILHYALYKPITSKKDITSEDDIPKIHTNESQLILVPMAQTTVYPIFEKQIERQSNLNAISAVMARNQSHNIGSHVLSRLSSNKEFEVDKIVRSYENAQYCPTKYKSGDSDKWECSYKKDYEEKQQREKYNLDNFLQWNRDFGYDNVDDRYGERATNGMETYKRETFINCCINDEEVNCLSIEILERLWKQELSNQYIATLQSYMKARQELLAEIVATPATFFNSLDLKADMLTNFTENRMLLDRISGIDNFKFTIIVELKGLGEQDDISLAIANGLMGQHAFFIILENIIRNTAKHGLKICRSKVTFTVRFQESSLDNNYYRCTVFDNIEPEKEANVENLISEQNKRINNPILDKDNKLRQEALGMIEMKACAAYLRGIPLEELEDKGYELVAKEGIENLKSEIKAGKAKHRILRGVKVNSDFLGYQFYIPKPKELLIVKQTNAPDFTDEHKKNAGKNGITLVNKLEEGRIYPEMDMLYFDEEVKESIRPSFLPKRQLLYNDRDDSDLSQLLKDFNYSCAESCKNLKQEMVKRIVRNKFNQHNLFPTQEEDQCLIERSEGKEINIKEEDHGHDYQEICGQAINQITTHREKSVFKSKIGLSDGVGLPEPISPIDRMNYLDSALCNVTIIDERIQEGADTYYALQGNTERGKITYREVWQNTGVFIPHKKEVDLSSSDFSETKKKLLCYLKEVKKKCPTLHTGNSSENEEDNRDNKQHITNRAYTQIDCLIIHIGIIEKLLEAENKDKNKDDDKKRLLEKLREETKNGNLDIILTSGRAPNKLDPDHGFVGISILMPCVIEQRFKYKLHQLLLQIRPKNN